MDGEGGVLLVFAVGHPGTVDYHAGVVVAELGSEKRTSGDILCQGSNAALIITSYTNGIPPRTNAAGPGSKRPRLRVRARK